MFPYISSVNPTFFIFDAFFFIIFPLIFILLVVVAVIFFTDLFLFLTLFFQQVLLSEHTFLRHETSDINYSSWGSKVTMKGVVVLESNYPASTCESRWLCDRCWCSYIYMYVCDPPQKNGILAVNLPFQILAVDFLSNL